MTRRQIEQQIKGCEDYQSRLQQRYQAIVQERRGATTGDEDRRLKNLRDRVMGDINAEGDKITSLRNQLRYASG